jgi:hypothetical protein
VGAGRGNAGDRRRRRADGADPDAAHQNRDRRWSRVTAVAGWARARGLVRLAVRGARRGVRRVLPALGGAALRRRHRSPAALDRSTRTLSTSFSPDACVSGRAKRLGAWGSPNRLTRAGAALEGRL